MAKQATNTRKIKTSLAGDQTLIIFRNANGGQASHELPPTVNVDDTIRVTLAHGIDRETGTAKSVFSIQRVYRDVNLSAVEQAVREKLGIRQNIPVQYRMIVPNVLDEIIYEDRK